VLNPGAWSHYSYALADAAREIDVLIEVHISNIHAREEFRHHSVISPVASGVIAGLGLAGYDYALGHIASIVGSLDEDGPGSASVGQGR
jgi:3-dehydroquinate dehydratase-2